MGPRPERKPTYFGFGFPTFAVEPGCLSVWLRGGFIFIYAEPANIKDHFGAEYWRSAEIQNRGEARVRFAQTN